MKFCRLLLLIPLLVSCRNRRTDFSPYAPEEGKKEWSAFVCADPHYFSPALRDDGEAFRYSYIDLGDGKMAQYSDHIFQAFLEEAILAKPDAVIFTGDLTYNGEKASHEEFAKGCQSLLDEGIQPLIIPGNHDINSTRARIYHEDVAETSPSLTADEFRNLYFPFGMQQSFSRADDSFSYVYQASENLVILALDANSDNSGALVSQSKTWMEEELKKAQQEGKTVLPFSHQSVLLHHPFFIENYALRDSEQIEALFHRYGVSLSLAAHWHIQHIQESGGYHEILTSPICVVPNGYGVLHFDGESFSYSKKDLDMKAYAGHHKLSDPIFQNFQKEAGEFFDEMNRKHWGNESKPDGVSDDEFKKLQESYIRFNRAYFTGEPLDLEEYEDTLALWHAHPELRRANYVESILEDLPKDFRVFPMG